MKWMEIDRRWEEYLAELYRSDFDNGLNDRDRDVRKDNPEVLRCEVVMRRMKNGKSEDEDINNDVAESTGETRTKFIYTVDAV